ncbi:MAG: DUF1905 domain-containing protein [Ruminococcaceae bacterium]|jgi:hypothetical protein|nr:DUF1905 domain-containing protein [Oscillospiraceae bacterium]
MQTSYEFEAVIREEEDGGAYVVFPWDIREEFGRGRVKIRAEFDGIPYEGSIVNMGLKDEEGNVLYLIGVLKSIRKALGKGNGDTVKVVVTPL